MDKKGIEELLRENPFFEGISEEHIAFIAGCGKNVVFDEGETIFREGESADVFYVIRHGRVSIEIHSPTKQNLIVGTVDPGDVLGWSWLVPPYKWRFDAKAVELTRAISMDAACLRGKCEKDNALGYELSKRFSRITVDRLDATRLQLLDLYGVSR